MHAMGNATVVGLVPSKRYPADSTAAAGVINGLLTR
jgi:hypothetical protein